MPDVTVTDVPDRQRYEARRDGELAAWVEYRTGDGVTVFTHTETADASKGQGVGSTLVRHALDDARSRGVRVVPRCPFVADFIEQHPGYADLVDRTGSAPGT